MIVIGVCYGDRGHQRDTFISRSEQHIELKTGVFDGKHIKLSQEGNAVAVVEQPAIEKIRTAAA